MVVLSIVSYRIKTSIRDFKSRRQRKDLPQSEREFGVQLRVLRLLQDRTVGPLAVLEWFQKKLHYPIFSGIIAVKGLREYAILYATIG